jgi:hypothetical protein
LIKKSLKIDENVRKKTLEKRCGAKLKTGKFEKWSKN